MLFACGVIAFVVVFVILLSNASFTERSNSKGNSFGAGETALRLSTLDPIVGAFNLRPGQTRAGEIVVTNAGDPAFLSVTPRGSASSPQVAQALRLRVAPRAEPGNPAYNGPYADAGRIQLGTQGRDATSAWRFEITLPLSAPPLAGQALDGSFEWETRTQ